MPALGLNNDNDDDRGAGGGGLISPQLGPAQGKDRELGSLVCAESSSLSGDVVVVVVATCRHRVLPYTGV